jgi:hypothetical protein
VHLKQSKRNISCLGLDLRRQTSDRVIKNLFPEPSDRLIVLRSLNLALPFCSLTTGSSTDRAVSTDDGCVQWIWTIDCEQKPPRVLNLRPRVSNWGIRNGFLRHIARQKALFLPKNTDRWYARFS